MIYVCDSIMGSGKSQSAIQYMNNHSDKKFIYVTPYLEEISRIIDGCSALKFVEPSEKIPEYGFAKLKHTAALIKQGRNIASTHQALRMYTKEMLEDVQNQGYTLIMDENIGFLAESNLHPDDIDILKACGWLKENENGEYEYCELQYRGALLRRDLLPNILDDVKGLLISNPKLEKGIKCYWKLSKKIFTSFSDVFVLTYLFDGQDISYMFKMYDLEYQKIGIEKTGDGEYRFSENGSYIPEYVKSLKEKIHICSNLRMNAVGDERFSLSRAWFNKEEKQDDIRQLRCNISNYFRNIMKESSPATRLWATYKFAKKKICGLGYTTCYTAWNLKATNDYRNKKYLVYAANIYMNCSQKIYFKKNNIEPDEDLFALSSMIQWVWRSAIRDGEDIYIYIPSRRMRELLTQWIDEVSSMTN